MTARQPFIGGIATLTLLLLPTASPAAERVMANALPPGHVSCHARVLNAAEKADPERRIVSMALDRTARDLATEKKWGAMEQFDDTPVVSVTLRVRLRGDAATHEAHLQCTPYLEGGNTLVCETPACTGGEIRMTGEGLSGIAMTIGGKLKGGRFLRHYIHLDDSCEGRGSGPLVLEQDENERAYSLAPAPKEACR